MTPIVFYTSFPDNILDALRSKREWVLSSPTLTSPTRANINQGPRIQWSGMGSGKGLKKCGSRHKAKAGLGSQTGSTTALLKRVRGALESGSRNWTMASLVFYCHDYKLSSLKQHTHLSFRWSGCSQCSWALFIGAQDPPLNAFRLLEFGSLQLWNYGPQLLKFALLHKHFTIWLLFQGQRASILFQVFFLEKA